MPFCHECGVPIDEAARFCATCGKPQQMVDATTPAASAATSGEAQALGSPQQSARSDVAGAAISILGGGLLLLSAFLPWMTARVAFASISRNAFQLGNQMGFSADGLVLTLLGLVAILIGITRSLRASLPVFIQRSPIIVGIAAVLVPLVRVGSINSLAQKVSSSSGLASASVGFGVWLAIFAAVITVVGGLLLRSERLATDASPTLSMGGASSSPSSRADEPVLFDVVITAMRSDSGTIARMVSDDTGLSRESVLAVLGTLPATVLHGVGFATAEGVRRDIAARGGNQVSVVPVATEQAPATDVLDEWLEGTVAPGGGDDAAWASAADPLSHPPGPSEN